MNENKNGGFEKEKWITPEINEISGLDTCDVLTNSSGLKPGGDNNDLPPLP